MFKIETPRLGVWQPRFYVPCQDLSQVTESQNIRNRRDFNHKLQASYLWWYEYWSKEIKCLGQNHKEAASVLEPKCVNTALAYQYFLGCL